MSAIDTLQDALYGNPPVEGFKPDRAGVLQAFSELHAAVLDIAAGVPQYDTVASLPTVTTANNGELARVSIDPTAANNTFWVVEAGVWEKDTDFVNNLAAVLQPQVDAVNAALSDATDEAADAAGSAAAAASSAALLAALLPAVVVSSTKNLLDISARLAGFELNNSTGLPTAYATSVVSAPIDVEGMAQITISGLPINTDGTTVSSRQWAAYNAAGTKLGSATYFSGSLTSVTITLPAGATTFRFDLSKRGSLSLDWSATQVEVGATATSFTAFVTSYIKWLGNKRLVNPAIVMPLPTYVGKDDQLFNPSTATATLDLNSRSCKVIEGYATYANGALYDDANSAAVMIYVGHIRGEVLSIGGLPVNSASSRGYAFYSAKPPLGNANVAAAQALRVAGSTISAAAISGTLSAVPLTADWLVFSPRQSNASAPSYANIVVNVATTPVTGPRAFVPQIALLDGVPVGGLGAGDVTSPAHAGGIGFGITDSIGEVTNVDISSYLYPTGYRANWPDTAMPLIAPTAYYSFGKSGASFRNVAAPYSTRAALLLTTPTLNARATVSGDAGTHAAIAGEAGTGGVPATVGASIPNDGFYVGNGTAWRRINDRDAQYFSNQVTTAINYATTNSLSPRWIIVALGTNDFTSNWFSAINLGTYAAAMAKNLLIAADGTTTTTLDTAIPLEAMRLGLARLRWRFPTATIFVQTPLPRGDVPPQSMVAWVDAIIAMAGAYGCEVIDAFRQSGIVSDHEGTTCVGSISGTTFDVTSVLAGKPLAVGMVIQAVPATPGGDRVENCAITALGTGTGGVGTYTVNVTQSKPSQTITALGGTNLSDGLHPSTAGQSTHGKCNASKMIPRLL